ncbi:MAG: helix-turn-helix transcriptional regulator [Candidatus Eremiobacteraeota bacterium]|nr:helix-turn-helix transcriptional regulator [Candidatus Eremiobacteraeota bacterium]
MSMQRCCPPARIAAKSFEREAELLKAISDSYRLRILATLARAADPVCVCDFTDALPLNQPTVSHHLRILRDAGLVRCERRGTWVYYELAADALDRIEAAIGAVFKQKVSA